jgi:hypothetical protein
VTRTPQGAAAAAPGALASCAIALARCVSWLARRLRAFVPRQPPPKPLRIFVLASGKLQDATVLVSGTPRELACRLGLARSGAAFFLHGRRLEEDAPLHAAGVRGGDTLVLRPVSRNTSHLVLAQLVQQGIEPNPGPPQARTARDGCAAGPDGEAVCDDDAAPLLFCLSQQQRAALSALGLQRRAVSFAGGRCCWYALAHQLRGRPGRAAFRDDDTRLQLKAAALAVLQQHGACWSATETEHVWAAEMRELRRDGAYVGDLLLRAAADAHNRHVVVIPAGCARVRLFPARPHDWLLHSVAAERASLAYEFDDVDSFLRWFRKQPLQLQGAHRAATAARSCCCTTACRALLRTSRARSLRRRCRHPVLRRTAAAVTRRPRHPAARRQRAASVTTPHRRTAMAPRRRRARRARPRSTRTAASAGW